MAELNILGFQKRESLLHRLDVRSKIAILLLLNLAGLQSSPLWLGIIFFLLIILIVHLKLSILAIISQTRWFLVLLVFVFVVRSVSIEGRVLFSILSLEISVEGVQSAAIYCWRLICVLLAGILFVSSTTSSDIRAGIEWFLRYIPFLPEKRVAIMISLMIRFLPMILDASREIRDAQKSRGIDQVKNPIKRLVVFSVPLLRKVFKSADQYILALEARCFSEERTPPGLTVTVLDAVVLCLVVPTLLLMTFFQI